MSWIAGILAALAALIYGLYQAGPGYNKRKQKKKDEEWLKKWNELQQQQNKK